MKRNKSQFQNLNQQKDAIDVARGLRPADLVIENASWLDVFTGRFRRGDLAIYQGMIVGLGEDYEAKKHINAEGQFIVPGFIDSHVHVESSLMTPERFEEAALPQGTTTAIWDPHEIANVWGREGISWALESVSSLDLDCFVMLPSCVPSTSPELGFENSGAVLKASDLREFQHHPHVLGLAEMMNFPGVLHHDADVAEKMMDFKSMPRDGHCPGLEGKDLNAYAVAGIHSCHESTQLKEAENKLARGIHVLIREGSCAKDADTLLPLLDERSAPSLGFCSDDRNPLDILEEGHIGCIINKALKLGQNPIDVFRAASFGPAQHYGLGDRGALAPGYTADFCLVKPINQDWKNGYELQSVYKSGQDRTVVQVDENNKKIVPRPRPKNLNLEAPTLEQLKIASQSSNGSAKVRVIEVIPEQILTRSIEQKLSVDDRFIQADSSEDILKIAVFERHHRTGHHGCGFVKGFGIKSGAIATSINHDSHNIIAVGSTDELMLKAIHKLMDIDGGIVVVDDRGKSSYLELPVAGLMTSESPDKIAATLRELKAHAKSIGCVLNEPFLQLSFLALPVIPSLKITDQGLIDVDQFKKVAVELESSL